MHQKAVQNFVKSLVGYSLITYLLQVSAYVYSTVLLALTLPALLGLTRVHPFNCRLTDSLTYSLTN